jgi:UDP-N-acetylmuramoyl-tripeptide--D-alanyl-D-alanine ligase
VADIKLPANGRKFAAMGDMLELGAFKNSEHEKILYMADALKYDGLFLFGNEMSAALKRVRNSLKIPFAECYSDKESLALALKKEIQSDDILLVKGSRSMKMELIAESLKLMIATEQKEG